MTQKVLVAMSGGVDSSTAAAILKKEGFEVAGATLKLWTGEARRAIRDQHIEDARRLAQEMGIEHFILDYEDEFKREVIQYFAEEYRRGRTPNPCVFCNRTIKFAKLLEEAARRGFDFIATGHYARKISRAGRFLIQEGIDKTKDQAYVLYSLSQEVLAKTLFPLGEQSKKETRALAGESGLTVSEKPDSMEICFVPEDDYVKFLEEEMGFKKMPGSLRLENGKTVGEHDGFYHFTIGQRRGLGVAWKEPLYVVRIDAEQNEVIVGAKPDVLGKEFRVAEARWLIDPADALERPALVKIRANSPKAAARIFPSKDKKSVKVVFDEPQEAITPGQSAVFYGDDIVLGGGIIENVAR